MSIFCSRTFNEAMTWRALSVIALMFLSSSGGPDRTFHMRREA